MEHQWAIYTLFLAISDAIFVYIADVASRIGGAPIDWQQLKIDLCQATSKVTTSANLIQKYVTEKNVQVMFLQEVTPNTLTSLREKLNRAYDDWSVDTDEEREEVPPVFFNFYPPSSVRKQQSYVAIRSDLPFVFEKAYNERQTGFSDEVTDNLKKLNEGDMSALIGALDDIPIQLASFHGESTGYSSLNFVAAANQAFTEYSLLESGDPYIQLLGLDANTCKPDVDGKEVSVKSFLSAVHDQDLRCVQEGNDALMESLAGPEYITTHKARSPLQPQATKTIAYSALATKSDMFPKDYILVDPSVKVNNWFRDNSGLFHFVHDIAFPTFSFPSDHAIIYSEVEFAATERKLNTFTWNMASVNDNVFEYWFTEPVTTEEQYAAMTAQERAAGRALDAKTRNVMMFQRAADQFFYNEQYTLEVMVARRSFAPAQESDLSAWE
jgi:hypothetical protein